MAERRSRPKRKPDLKTTKKTSASRKRIRRRLKWGPIFWLLLVVQLIVGLIWSRVTSPWIIYVWGSKSFDEARIRGHIQRLKGCPFLQIPNRQIESLIMNNASIKSCQLETNILGRGSLSIKMREPRARLDGYKNLYIDDEGVVFTLPVEYKNLVTIKLAQNLSTKNFTLSGIWESQKSVQVCIKLSKWLHQRPFIVEVDGRGLILVELQNITKIFLGSFENIEEKLEVLNRWLEKDEEFLTKVKMLNLSVPKFPTYIPKF